METLKTNHSKDPSRRPQAKQYKRPDMNADRDWALPSDFGTKWKNLTGAAR